MRATRKHGDSPHAPAAPFACGPTHRGRIGGPPIFRAGRERRGLGACCAVRRTHAARRHQHLRPDDSTNAESMVMRADQVLHTAKVQGRNRCFSFKMPMDTVEQLNG